MDAETKQEILLAISAAQEETVSLVNKCITDQIGIRTELGQLRAEVEAVKARGSAWDAADAGHSRALADGLAEAKRIATETREEGAANLRAVTARHNELATKITAVGDSVEAIKKDVGAQVLEALGSHVAKIEEAAAALTRSPRVKTAATVGGAFAGSAAVAALFEILRHL